MGIAGRIKPYEGRILPLFQTSIVDIKTGKKIRERNMGGEAMETSSHLTERQLRFLADSYVANAILDILYESETSSYSIQTLEYRTRDACWEDVKRESLRKPKGDRERDIFEQFYLTLLTLSQKDIALVTIKYSAEKRRLWRHRRVEISDRFKIGTPEGNSLHSVVRQNIKEYWCDPRKSS